MPLAETSVVSLGNWVGVFYAVYAVAAVAVIAAMAVFFDWSVRRSRRSQLAAVKTARNPSALDAGP